MTKTIELDPAEMEGIQIYKILTGCIVPRPIGWISTVSKSGTYNAAPYSFFNGLSHIPPLVCFSVSVHYNQEGRQKDTLTNVIDTNEFVFNLVNEDLAVAQDVCSEPFPPEVDEFVEAKLTAVPGKRVKAPRIVESPVNFECTVVSVQPLPGSVYTLVIGQVVYMHLREDILQPDGRIDLGRLAAVGRMTGDSYTHTREVFTLEHDAYKTVVLGDKAK
ncbi:MAG: flavin reductase family protein [Proteobacteria bacterium]|nr:flavin reductase family protein [Pseudomonadota bacterium]